MTARRVVSALLMAAGLPGVLAAQVRASFRASGVYEAYTFDPGLSFTKVGEFSAPVGVDLSLGRLANVTVSGGFVALSLTSADATVLADQSLSGLLDTQVRVGFNLIPGRLILVTNGTLPTGTRPDVAPEVSVLGAVSSDVIGFAIPSLGTGGSVGGGLIGALPLGKLALGLGATYLYPFAYSPVTGESRRIEPGAEVRGRLGLEGPLARRTFLRIAGVVGARAKDVLGDTVQNGVGTRYIGYLELVQGLGSMQLTLYGFDVYRGAPAVEPTAVGAAVLPKGNLLVGGLRHSIPLGTSLSVSPRIEYRLSTAAPDTSSAMEKAGSSVRFGLDLRQALSPGMSVALYGSGLFGKVRQVGVDIPISGWRAGLILELHQ